MIELLRKELSEKTLNRLGYDLNKFPQNSPEWFKARLGVITGSQASNLIKNGRKKGTKSEGWNTYMAELIAEIDTGRHHEINARPLDWGHEHESSARELYAFECGISVQELTFVYSDDMRCGASIDGIREDGRGTEIKCPYNSTNHFLFVLDQSKVKNDYEIQMQFEMRTAKLESIDFISYDPRARKNSLSYVTFFIDEDIQGLFDERIPEFIEEMDYKLESLGLKFGDQWK